MDSGYELWKVGSSFWDVRIAICVAKFQSRATENKLYSARKWYWTWEVRVWEIGELEVTKADMWSVCL